MVCKSKNLGSLKALGYVPLENTKCLLICTWAGCTDFDLASIFSLALSADCIWKYSKQILNAVVCSLVLVAGETGNCNTCCISVGFCCVETGVTFWSTDWIDLRSFFLCLPAGRNSSVWQHAKLLGRVHTSRTFTTYRGFQYSNSIIRWDKHGILAYFKSSAWMIGKKIMCFMYF